MYNIVLRTNKMNTQKLEEATQAIRELNSDELEIIPDGKHADDCRLKGKGINIFAMPLYAEGTCYCRVCHHLVQAPFKEA